jgi:hypothetical protein
VRPLIRAAITIASPNLDRRHLTLSSCTLRRAHQATIIPSGPDDALTVDQPFKELLPDGCKLQDTAREAHSGASNAYILWGNCETALLIQNAVPLRNNIVTKLASRRILTIHRLHNDIETEQEQTIR